MTYDAAKAGNSGTDAEVELSAGKVIAGTKDTSIFTKHRNGCKPMETE